MNQENSEIQGLSGTVCSLEPGDGTDKPPC
jgi:hypothetical protein